MATMSMSSRENQHESRAVTRKIYRIPAADRVPAPLGKALPVVSREEVRTLLPDLTATGGYVLDKGRRACDHEQRHDVDVDRQ